MSIDGIVLRCLVHELNATCASGRIVKIHQPTPYDLVLTVRAHGETHRLLLSANPSAPRLHLTDQPFANPTEPPMFCMLLRKHLEGGVLQAITQVALERIVHLDVLSRDELGDPAIRRLVVEIMGRHSNIILVDPKTGTILDGIRHVTPAISQYRVVLPGRPYVAPPAQDKLNPLETSRDAFLAALDFNAGKLDQQLLSRFLGIGPVLAREIVHRAGLPTREALWEAFSRLMDDVRAHRYRPTRVRTADGKDVFAAVALTGVSGETLAYDSMSRLLDDVFRERTEREAIRQRLGDLARVVKNEIKKHERKRQLLLDTLAETRDAERYRLFGELLTAHLHEIPRGASEVQLPNYYEEGLPMVTIPLDPAKSAAENAQAYFKKYNKAKVAAETAAAQLAQAEAELRYLETVAQQLEDATLADAEEIRDELIEQGYLKPDKGGRRKGRETASKPAVFRSSEGYTILVGKNNRQNERLRRQAAPSDTWLHAKDIPGAHVIIRGTGYGEATLLEAAMLAAYFSKARHSSRVPVDYTEVRHVRKPAGAKPGFVIYERQKTVYVTPDEALVRRLAADEGAGRAEEIR